VAENKRETDLGWCASEGPGRWCNRRCSRRGQLLEIGETLNDGRGDLRCALIVEKADMGLSWWWWHWNSRCRLRQVGNNKQWLKPIDHD
jgi:hypothetical protein